MEDERVVVIGGGVIGVTTAFLLKLKSPRAKVLLLERNSDAGQECSFQNGAVLNYSSCDVWPSPSFPLSFLRGVWDRDNKFQHNIGNLLTPGFWIYAARMLVNCTKQAFERNSAALWRLGQRSYLLHQALRDQLRPQFAELLDSYNFRFPGTLNLYDTNADFEHAKQRGEQLKSTLNQKFEYYHTRKHCAAIEPLISELESEVVGCAKNHSEDIGSHDSFRYTHAFLSIGRALGVEVLFDAKVTAFRVENRKVTALMLDDSRIIEADKFVIAAGIHSKSLGALLGWTPPLWAVKGYTMNVSSEKHPLRYLISPHGKFGTYLVPQGDSFRYSFFAEFTNESDTLIDPSRAQKAEDLLRSYTGFRDLQFTDHWACLRPVSCDDLPIIGKFPGLENVYLNVGQGSRGSILAMGSAELCADIVLGAGKTVVDAQAFSPDRFYF